MSSQGVPLLAAVLLASAVLVAPGRSRPETTSGSPGDSGCSGEGEGVSARDRARGVSAFRGDPGRSALTTEDVIESLVLLALAFRSGLPTCDVIEAVSARSDGAVAHDLRQVATALRWGASDDEAWAVVDPVWAPAARAIALASRAGIAPGPLLLRAADDLGRAELERLEVAAAKVTVRLVLPLGLVLLPAFVLTTVLPIVAALARQVLAAT